MIYFTYSEFDCKSEPGSGDRMKLYFVYPLDRAREIAGVPFIINSGYRTHEHNKRIGGSPTSSHLTGYAADIKCNEKTRQTIFDALKKAGFNRIGIARNFIHVDRDPKKAPAIWFYDEIGKTTKNKPEWLNLEL